MKHDIDIGKILYARLKNNTTTFMPFSEDYFVQKFDKLVLRCGSEPTLHYVVGDIYYDKINQAWISLLDSDCFE